MLPTAQEVAQRAARVVIDGVRDALASGRSEPVIGLATGSSPLGLYAVLSGAVAAGEVSFERARGFALDEYVGLPPGHPQSYREVLLREVCGPFGLPADRLHVPDGSGDSEEALRPGRPTTSGGSPRPAASTCRSSGSGRTATSASTSPGSALTSRTRVKRLSERTRADNARFFDSLDAVPTHCVTQGLGTVLDARRLVLVASGPGKAAAVAAAVEGPLSASCPASVLQWHADAVVVLDEAAAAGLANRDYYDASAAGL